MKGKRILISILAVGLGLLLILVTGLALAQGPGVEGEVGIQAALGTAFTYQGHLTDGGSPANGTYDLEFKLYDAASNGNQVGSTVAKDDVAVTDGLFTVELDFGSGVFTGDARYLEIGVRPGTSVGAYTTLLPRQALTPAPYALALPGLWTQQNATSPNLIGGYSSNSVTAGVEGATIGGGGASGYTHRVTDDYGTVSGGRNNQAGDNDSTISDAHNATVGGGEGNTAGSSYATVGGGLSNAASAPYATAGGGGYNSANGWAATVGGGDGNHASGQWATVPGGRKNAAQGYYSFAAGQRAKANHQGAFVWADSTEADFASTTNNQFAVRANGGVVFSTGGASFRINGGDAWTSANDGSGSGLDADKLDGQDGAYYLDWSNLTNVPTGFADGVDDTDDTVSWGEISGIVGAGANQVAAGDHTHDDRYYTESELQTSGSASVHWGNLTHVPAGFADDVDNDTLGGLSCGNGQIAEWDGSVWVCGDDDTGADGDFWSLTGNAGTNPTTNFLGTTDNQALELRVNNARALRLEPNADSPNLIGGYSGNDVTDGVVGATIGGGGASGSTNRVTDNYGTVGGGMENIASGSRATVAGGESNTASAWDATVGGGYDNVITGTASNATVGGGFGNVITGTASYATISGGYSNEASGGWATVGGGASNVVTGTFATVGGGVSNIVSDDHATVGGGIYNTACGEYATVGGGVENTACGEHATVGGGAGNTVSGNFATVSGGVLNHADALTVTIGGGEYISVTGQAATVAGGSWITITGDYAAVGGGTANVVTGTFATIGGGVYNGALGMGATVGGGGENLASGDAATVGGGIYNTASGGQATVGGGWNNTASGENATVPGGLLNTARGDYATVGGGYLNHADALTVTIGGGEYISVTGQAATVAGGSYITVTGDYAAVGGGVGNVVTGTFATIGGGVYNGALGMGATVGGGVGNVVTGTLATVGGGGPNTASGDGATIGGGGGNAATGTGATVGGGEYNIASGVFATIPGGLANAAEGEYSFAAGYRAKANHDGAFIWADSTDADVESQRDNQFLVRAYGGSRFEDGAGLWVELNWSPIIDTSTGAYLSNGGIWTNASDRDVKENFTLIDGQEVLTRLTAVPISTWNYKAEDSSVRHIGPTAQDFYATFGLGDSDKAIGTLDADGVALAAIQGLYQVVQEKDAQIAAQQQRIDDLETRVAALEQAAGAPRSSQLNLPGGWWPLFLGGLVVAAGVVVQRRHPGGGQ